MKRSLTRREVKTCIRILSLAPSLLPVEQKLLVLLRTVDEPLPCKLAIEKAKDWLEQARTIEISKPMQQALEKRLKTILGTEGIQKKLN